MGIMNWFPDCDVRVARNEEDLERLREWFGVPLQHPEHNHDAFSSFLTGETSDPVAVVFIKEGISRASLYGLVAHESTHCAMDYMQSIGEKEFSPEFIAYVIQSFTLEIMEQIVVG